MNCLKCKTKIEFPEIEYGVLVCHKCNFEYLVVSHIPIMVNKKNDFYNYNHKLKRLVNIKNE